MTYKSLKRSIKATKHALYKNKLLAIGLVMAIGLSVGGTTYAYQQFFAPAKSAVTNTAATKKVTAEAASTTATSSVAASDAATKAGANSDSAATSTTTKTTSNTQTPNPNQIQFTPTPIRHDAFAIKSIYLDHPSIVCTQYGTNIYIGDVDIWLDNTTGGDITYGYETRGELENPWGTYHQTEPIAKDIQSTSFNKLYYGVSQAPQMAYSQTISTNHGAGSVRAVIYAPQLVYSSWFDIPAHVSGDACS